MDWRPELTAGSGTGTRNGPSYLYGIVNTTELGPGSTRDRTKHGTAAGDHTEGRHLIFGRRRRDAADAISGTFPKHWQTREDSRIATSKFRLERSIAAPLKLLIERARQVIAKGRTYAAIHGISRRLSPLQSRSPDFITTVSRLKHVWLVIPTSSTTDTDTDTDLHPRPSRSPWHSSPGIAGPSQTDSLPLPNQR